MLLFPIPVALLPYFHNKGAGQTVWLVWKKYPVSNIGTHSLSHKFMDNCCISCQVMADMKKVSNNLRIVNLYFLKTDSVATKLLP